MEFVRVFPIVPFHKDNSYNLQSSTLDMKALRLVILTCLVMMICMESAKAQSGSNVNKKADPLLWGHYRPHRLSIVTQRLPSPISVGLLYSPRVIANITQDIFDSMFFRHSISNTNNNQLMAEYIVNDGERFSQQFVVEANWNVKYDIIFVKTDPLESSEHSWVYLVEPTPMDKNRPNIRMNTFVHITGESLDGEGMNIFEVVEEGEHHVLLKAYDMRTNTFKGYFHIEVLFDESRKIPVNTDKVQHLENDCKNNEIWQEYLRPQSIDPFSTNTLFCFMNVPQEEAWKHGKHIFSALVNDKASGSMIFDQDRCRPQNGQFNLGILQVSGIQLDYKVRVTHHSEKVPTLLSVKEITDLFIEHRKNFYKRLDETFPIKNVPVPELIHSLGEMRKGAISNLLGGLCYAYGSILTKHVLGQNDITYDTQEMKELFSTSPSRISFPRGFLWDEGFHLLLVCRWNRRTCMEIIKSWLNTMSSTGWIPREQTRGAEQENSFRDKKFLYQNDQEANPPTLLLAIEYLMNKIDAKHPDYKEIVEFLNSGVQEKVIRWFEFFNTTQRNLDVERFEDIRRPLFRWTCVPPCEKGNILGSGLDDYPRAAEGEEPLANVDLQVWMIYMVKTINAISTYKGEAPAPEFKKLETDLVDALEEFKDDHYTTYQDLVQSLKDKEEDSEQLKKIYAVHFGYVTLFPLLFGLIPPENKAAEMTLALLTYPTGLWSEFGIRSLATIDTHYQKGEQYWTEPIWMNINYLILRGLNKHYMKTGNVENIYARLRNNLLRVVWTNWSKTMTFWENYSSLSGKGQRSPAFYGWTTLVILILSEEY